MSEPYWQSDCGTEAGQQVDVEDDPMTDRQQLSMITANLYRHRMAADYHKIDAAIEMLMYCNLPPKVLIGVLTVTAPIRTSLANRVAFFDYARAVCSEESLTGLE